MVHPPRQAARGLGPAAVLVALILLSTVAGPASAVQVEPTDARLPHALYGYGTARLGERSYLVGGSGEDRGFTDEIIEVTTGGTTAQAGTLPEPLLEPAVAATDSTLYIFGGAMEPTDGGLPTTTDAIRAFDPSTGDTTTLTATLPEPVSSASAVKVGAYIYILGGLEIEQGADGGSIEWHETIARFDPRGPSVTTVDASLPTGRGQMAAVALERSALLLGGMAVADEPGECDANQTSCPTGEILRFRPSVPNVGTLGELETPVRWASAGLYQGTAYLLGGCQANCGGHFGQDAIVEIDVDTGRTRTLPVTMPLKGGRHSATMHDGVALIPGGVRANGSGSVSHDRIQRVRLGVTPAWAPLELTVEPSARGSVTLSWEPPSYDGGADVTGYRVMRSSGARSPELLERVTGTSATDRSVELGQTYRYEVRAVNPSGVGPASNQVIVTPTATPGAPEVTAVGGDRKIVAQWSPPDEEGGSNLTGYRLIANPAGPNGSESDCSVATCLDLPAGSRYIEVTRVGGDPVENGETYTVQVQAQNEQGWGAPSEPIEATPHPVPDPPSELRFTKDLVDGEPVVNLTWKASPSDAVTRYRVHRGGSLADLSPVGSTSSLTFTDDGDVPRGIELIYGVTAESPDAASPLSQTVRLVFPEPPGPVRNVTAREDGGRVVVTWRAPGDLGGGALKGYDVAKTRGAIDPEAANATLERVTTEDYADDAPPRGDRSTYHVRAVTSGGVGPWRMAQILVGSSSDATPPDAILSVRPSKVDVGSNVAFDASGSRDEQGIAAYRFDFGDGSGTGWQSNPRAAHVYDERGVYSATLVVRDVTGVESDPAEATIAVGPPPGQDGGQGNETPPPDDDGNLLPVPTWLPLAALVLSAALLRARRWER